MYLKHQRLSGVSSKLLPKVTISPTRKDLRRHTGKERSMSRIVVAHWYKTKILNHTHQRHTFTRLEDIPPSISLTCSFQIFLLSLDTWPTVSPIKAINMLSNRTKVRMMYVTRRTRKTPGYCAPLSMSSSSPIPMVSLNKSSRNSLKVFVSRHSGYLGQESLHVSSSGQMVSRETNAVEIT